MKEYEVKGSNGDKLRFVFTINDVKDALIFFNEIARSRIRVQDNNVVMKIFYLLTGKFFSSHSGKLDYIFQDYFLSSRDAKFLLHF